MERRSSSGAEEHGGAAPDVRRVRWIIFALLFVSYAWFAQGGGWNQNARFGQVRSLAESGSFAMNGHLVYHRPDEANGGPQVRYDLPDRAPPPPDVRLLSSLDVTYHQGRFLPNKPPGTSMLAAPGYWLVSRIETALGIGLDGWRVLTVNAWLASLLSVGLIAAFGGVLLHRLAAELFPDAPPQLHVATALTCGLATVVFPFATLLMDHALSAVAILWAFTLLACPRADEPTQARLLAAGALCGVAVVANYTAALNVAVIGVYALSRVVRPGRAATFVAGGVVPALFLAWYHYHFFGSVLETVNSHQPEFMTAAEDSVLFGMIGLPDPAAAWHLLFSPYRGLLFSSPVLGLGIAGLWWMARTPGIRKEALACVGIAILTFLLNVSFNGWHGGWNFGPRYLIPAIPFLSLPLVLAYQRLPRVTIALAGISFSMMLVATSVGPLVPDPIPNPWTQYMIPLARGESLVLGAEHLTGPVSVNPTGLGESGAHRLFPPESEAAAWNSFNLGELLWPHSWLSIAPLLALQGLGLALLFRRPEPGRERWGFSFGLLGSGGRRWTEDRRRT